MHTDHPILLLPLSYHIVIIYPHSYNSPFHASIHLSTLPTSSPLFNSLSNPTALNPSSSSSPFSRGSAIENMHMIVINGFKLLARLSLPLPPPFISRQSLTLYVSGAAAHVSSLTKSNRSALSRLDIDLKCMSQGHSAVCSEGGWTIKKCLVDRQRDLLLT